MTVEKLVYGGDGLARLDGRVVFAPFVLPGERIRAEAEEEKPGMLRARATEVLEPSPDRVAPQCPFFRTCGGCHYQHAPYSFQVSAKVEILREALRRLGRIEPPEQVGVFTAEPWAYRNRAQFHISGGRLGYREARSHRLCAIDQCPISSPRINQLIAILNRLLHDPRWPRFVRSIEVFTDEQQVQLNVLETERPVARRFFEWCAEEIPEMVAGPLDYQGRWRVSRNSFFQVNRHLVECLTSLVEGAGESAVDLYAGVGLFSLPLARHFRQVTAVESGSTAVQDLAYNAERAEIANLQSVRATAEAYLEGLSATPDCVWLDPPRAGLGKMVVRRLAELKPPAVSIVACDPATLARDLAGLLAAGYRIQEMALIDLFPQTYHLETLVRLHL